MRDALVPQAERLCSSSTVNEAKSSGIRLEKICATSLTVHPVRAVREVERAAELKFLTGGRSLTGRSPLRDLHRLPADYPPLEATITSWNTAVESVVSCIIGN